MAVTSIPDILPMHSRYEPVEILVVDDMAIDRSYLRFLLTKVEGRAYSFFEAETGVRAMELLSSFTPDCVLLDYLLADVDGITFLRRVVERFPTLPIIMLTGQGNEDVAVEALKCGALDYLVKTSLSGPSLVKAIRHAMEKMELRRQVERQRQELEAMNRELLRMASTDELTGLLNRRGFHTQAEVFLRMARREGYHLAIAYVDIDNMKGINDRYGHALGDDALRRAAGILRMTFRESDLIARLGGDEFVVLTYSAAPPDTAVVQERLDLAIADVQRRQPALFPFELSLGLAALPVTATTTLQALLTEADALMYQQKLRKKNRRRDRSMG